MAGCQTAANPGQLTPAWSIRASNIVCRRDKLPVAFTAVNRRDLRQNRTFGEQAQAEAKVGSGRPARLASRALVAYGDMMGQPRDDGPSDRLQGCTT